MTHLYFFLLETFLIVSSCSCSLQTNVNRVLLEKKRPLVCGGTYTLEANWPLQIAKSFFIGKIFSMSGRLLLLIFALLYVVSFFLHIM